jgi:hypothetical protein
MSAILCFTNQAAKRKADIMGRGSLRKCPPYQTARVASGGRFSRREEVATEAFIGFALN